MRIEAKKTIAASPEAVFRVLADVEHWPDWEESFADVRLASGRPGSVGARYLSRRKVPREVQSRFVITAFEPGRQIAIEGDWIGSFKPAGGYRVDPDRDGSEVTSFATPELRGMMRLMTPMMAMMGARLSRRYLDNLEKVVMRTVLRPKA